MIDRHDWINAGLRAMRSGGIEAVAIEPLARDLNVTRGSFYWHFRDRNELLGELLRIWEVETDELIALASEAIHPLGCVLRFFDIVATNRNQIPDSEFFAWARREAKVAKTAFVIEAKHEAFICAQLVKAGVGKGEAARRAEAGYLATLGWIERATRNKQHDGSEEFRAFANQLFRFLFAGVREQRWATTRGRRALMRNGTHA